MRCMLSAKTMPESQGLRSKQRLIDELGLHVGRYFPGGAIQHEALWIGAVFANLRSAVTQGDPNAIEMAVQVIDQDPMWLPFGKLIKSDLARALRKNACQIGPVHRARIIAASVRLLKEAYLPRELEDYVKLIKKFSKAEYSGLVASVNPLCDKARTMQEYLLS